jgi:hypothetical protein
LKSLFAKVEAYSRANDWPQQCKPSFEKRLKFGGMIRREPKRKNKERWARQDTTNEQYCNLIGDLGAVQLDFVTDKPLQIVKLFEDYMLGVLASRFSHLSCSFCADTTIGN